MITHSLFLSRRSLQNKKVSHHGLISFKVHVLRETGIMIGLSAVTYDIDWGDGTWDTDLIHTYEYAGIYEIKISGVEINELNISRCWVKEIDLSGCPWLESLDISFNSLSLLDVSACPYLRFLDCSHGLIRTLLSGDQVSGLIYLNCSHNLLANLDLSHWPDLYYLNAHHNELRKMKFEHCIGVRCVDIAYNALRQEELQNAIASLPVVSQEEMACILYEMNPYSYGIDEGQMERKGWKGEVFK